MNKRVEEILSIGNFANENSKYQDSYYHDDYHDEYADVHRDTYVDDRYDDEPGGADY